MPQMEIIQFGRIIGGDLKENELIIETENNVIFAFKDVAVVVIENLNQKQLLEEFITKNFK